MSDHHIDAASGPVARTARRSAAAWALAALAAAALTALQGCALGPDYKRPAAPLDSGGFIATGAAGANAAEPQADLAVFWRGFGDATLTSLVERAVVANGDIRIAQARLQEARASLREADAAGRPGFGVEAGVTRSQAAAVQAPGLSRSERTATSWDGSFIANWELDLFGRYRRGSEAAVALADAGAAGVYAAQTSVVAEVAGNYLDLRGLQQRLAIAEAALVNQRETQRITRARFDAGRGTQLDLERANSLVATTEAALPALQTAIERAVFRIATLVARPPRALLAELGPAAPLPGLPVTDLARLPVGTPEQWLLRRPDLIVAERQLAAATANVGVARTELYPRLSLSGLLGLTAATFGNLGRGDAVQYSGGIGMTWTPFDLGGIRARIGQTEARVEQSLANYEQTVAIALEETEGAFSGYTRSAQRAERQSVATGHAQAAARLARLRFGAGVADFSVVLDAERDALSSEDVLMQVRTATATSLVSVYRALGGGWDAAAARGTLGQAAGGG